jgi:hypothetical protein
VHPSFQRRGIAKKLMVSALDTVRERGGKLALLQVDDDNIAAIDLYRSLGFVTERAFTTYKRMPSLFLPRLATEGLTYVRRRRRSEWRAEMDLAVLLRSTDQGGLGWVRPIVQSLFQPSLVRFWGDMLNFRQHDRYVATNEYDQLAASLWVERSFGLTTRLTLLVPPTDTDLYTDALLATAVRQYGAGSLLLEHPADDTSIQATLSRFRFNSQRTVIHMRWTP